MCKLQTPGMETLVCTRWVLYMLNINNNYYFMHLHFAQL